MSRFLVLASLLAVAACGEGGPARDSAAPTAAPGARANVVAAPPAMDPELAGAEIAIARSGCVRCHAAPAALHERWRPQPGPALANASFWHRADDGAAFLRQHHGGAAATDLAAWVRSLAMPGVVEPGPVAVTPAQFERGERRLRELACRACHTPVEFAGLAARTDQATLAAFLAAPHERRPGLVHPSVSAAEAGDLAAALLRSQAGAAASQPGFARTSWLCRIESAGQPDLTTLAPHDHAVVDAIDTARPPAENHFVLQFAATIDVPAAGEWTFTTGSDDSSWLWIDGTLVVSNEGLAPYRRRDGTITLTAGKHDLGVLYTEAAGDAKLDVLWRGPGVAQQPIPKSVATASTTTLQPAPRAPEPAAEAIARGRAAARERRCDACHAIDDPAFAALPAPALARPFEQLGAAPCPQNPAGTALQAMGQELSRAAWGASERLQVALLRDGCTSCHARDGRGGLPATVRAELAEVEDLGDEGRVPPDLTAVGRRLRPAWLQKVLATGHSVRPYLRVRMPALGEPRAREYAEMFTAVDGGGDAAEPTFSVEQAQRGRELAGLGGRNCVTCHTFQGLRSAGIQGMDLAVQHERLQPGWFRDWLLHPTTLRQGTRMPTLWLVDDAAARAEIDAIRCWLSLGAAAPLPAGVRGKDDSLELVASDRPKLHGAFLDGVSARCLLVGTPERTHFAFDLQEPRLVWIWRGAFVDATGTWVGRAGKLVRPLGSDWKVLADVGLDGGARRELRGQRRTADGYPVLQVRAGDVDYDDEVRARLAASGSELVRTLRVQRGVATFVFGSAEGVTVTVAGAVAARHRVAAGESLEVVYRW